MELLSNLQPVGHVTITKVYKDGTKEVLWDKDNLIVTLAKQFILSGIYAPGVVSDPISTLRVGTGGNIDPQGLYPKAEDPLQTSLNTQILSLPVAYNLDLNNISVTYLADVDQSQCNGQLLTEVGLFKVTGAMFNIKNHPAISKTSDFSVHYDWTIKLL